MNEEERQAQQEEEAQANVQKMTVEDEQTLTTVEEWFEENRTHRDARITQRWRTNLEIHENRMKGETSARTQIKVGLSRVDVRTQMAIAGDYFPRINIVPVDKKSDNYSDAINLRINNALDDVDFEYKALDCLEQSLIMSNGITCILPELVDGKLYGLDIKDVDVHTCFPAPGATDLTLEDARNIIFATPMHVDEIKRITISKDHPDGISVPAEGKLDNDGTFKQMSKEDDNYDKQANSALYKECYWIDADVKKYPCGRQVHWANGVLLKDEPLWNRYTPKPGEYVPKIPYFMIKNNGTARSFFGVGEPEIVSKIKKSLDETLSATADNVRKMGNPPIKVKYSWVQWGLGKIRHTPAEKIMVQHVDDVTFEHGIPCPQSTFQFIELMLKVHHYEIGIQEVSVGKRDKQAESGRAILALQEAANKVVRDKINNPISKYLGLIGRQLLWYFQEYDTEEIELPVGESRDEEGKQVFKKYNPADIKKSKFKVKVVPGTGRKRGRIATEERALEFLNIGFYSIEIAVDDVDISPERKQAVIDAWYKNQGMAEIKAYLEKMDKARGELKRLTDKAKQSVKEENTKGLIDLEEQLERYYELSYDYSIRVANEWIGSIDEKNLSDLLIEFEGFLNDDEFKYLPFLYKFRLIKRFLDMPEDITAGVQ